MALTQVDQGLLGTYAQYTGFKNRIINGTFGINQRVVSGTVTLTAGSYGHDRFKAGASGCTYTFATSANITTLTITAGSLIQVIEGINLESATYTLSFSGTAQGKIGGGSFSSSGVTGSVTGGSNLNIEFNTGTLSLVQLEKGSTATSFDYRSFNVELILCQRYFQKTYNTAQAPGTNIGDIRSQPNISVPVSISGQALSFSCFFKTTMRTNATIVYYDAAGTSGKITGIASSTAQTNGVSLNDVQGTDSAVYFRAYDIAYYGFGLAFTASAEL
jgi:hypothetical protein